MRVSPAEKFKVELVFHDRLIAAARERHILGERGEGIVLVIARAVESDADAHRGVDACEIDDRMNALDEREAVFRDLVKMPLFKNEDVPVAVHAPENAAASLAPFLNGNVELAAQLGALAVGERLHQLVVVIHEHDHHDRARGEIFLFYVVVLGHVHPVGDAHELIGLLALSGADHVAVDLILFPVHLEKIRHAVFALEQPLAVEFRHERGELRVERGARAAAHLPERLVAPDDAAVVQTEHRHRQRKVDERVVRGGFGVVGDVLNERLQLLLARPRADERVDREQHRDDRLAVGDIAVEAGEKEGYKREYEHDEQAHAEAGLGKFLRFAAVQSILSPRPPELQSGQIKIQNIIYHKYPKNASPFRRILPLFAYFFAAVQKLPP